MLPEIKVRSFALPDDEHIPPCSPEFSHLKLVAGHIGLQFWNPVGFVGLRKGAASTPVLMPETTVNKNCGTMLLQHDVRLSRKGLVMKAEPKAERMQEASGCQF